MSASPRRSTFSPEAMALMRRAYAARLPELLERMQRAWARASSPHALAELQALSERVAGSAAICGFEGLSEQAAELARVVASGRDPAARDPEWDAAVRGWIAALRLTAWEICFTVR